MSTIDQIPLPLQDGVPQQSLTRVFLEQRVPLVRDWKDLEGTVVTLTNNLTQFAQFIPGGFYDTARISITTDGDTAVRRGYVAFGLAQSSQGIGLIGGSVIAFMNTHGPVGSTVIGPNNRDVIVIECPVTNSPLIVWATDNIDIAAADAVRISVTYLTVRH
jgi:hypothetical protein